MTFGEMTKGKQINIVFHDKKLAFMIQKKCASVTFHKVILKSFGHENLDGKNINRVFRKYFTLINKYDLDKLNYDVISWVRNPFDRLVSGWFHRIRNNAKHSVRDYGIPHTTSFDEFINYVCSFKDEDLNVHFHQQTHDLAIGDKLVPNNIVKIENLQEDWEGIRQKFEWLRPIEWHANKTKERGNYRLYYTEDLIQKVSKRFKTDLDLLDYEF